MKMVKEKQKDPSVGDICMGSEDATPRTLMKNSFPPPNTSNPNQVGDVDEEMEIEDIPLIPDEYSYSSNGHIVITSSQLNM